jgi:hypothetical protein
VVADEGGVPGADLAEVIGKVREDLERAQRQGAQSGLRFRVDRVCLEFAVQVRREGNGSAGLKLGVVTANAGAAVARENLHTVTVDLVPQEDGGEGWLVGNWSTGAPPAG